MRMPALGNQFFNQVRTNDCLYVDKTELMARIEDMEEQIILFTRPRRFGKSLSLSMLDCYFEEKDAGNGWFDGLRISEMRPDDPLKNSMPVVFLDLKNLSSRTYGDFMEHFRREVSSACSRFKDIVDSVEDPVRRDTLGRLATNRCTDNDVIYSMRYLCEAVAEHSGKGVLLLIDEYDSVPNSCTDPELRRMELDTIRDFLSMTLKGNGGLWRAVLTGITQIARNDLFSGLNNIRIDDITSRGFDDIFGFTEPEVAEICRYYRKEDRLDEIRTWYDGYRFGNADLYNPWSVLEYICSDWRPECHWVRTGGVKQISDMLSDPGFRSVLEDVMSGKDVYISFNPSMSYDTVGVTHDNALSFLAMCGYLRLTEEIPGTFRVSLPNREIGKSLGELLVAQYDPDSPTHLAILCEALKAGRTDLAVKQLEYMFMKYMSVRVASTEGAAQSFIVGMMAYLTNEYEVTMDTENGEGYPDIAMRSLSPKHPSIVIEVKRGSGDESDDAMQRLAESAVEQIKRKDYAFDMNGVHMYGVAVRGKRVFVHFEAGPSDARCRDTVRHGFIIGLHKDPWSP